MKHMDIPPKLLAAISNVVSLFLFIALFFTLQYLLEMDFFCSCRPGLHLNDVMFVAAPPLILTLIITLIERFYQKQICSFRRNYYCCKNICRFFFKFFIKFIYLGAVWVSTVLFDGDWFFCLLTNLNTNQTGIPCKKDLTHKETLIKNNYMNQSRVWGFAVIAVFFLCLNFYEFFKGLLKRSKGGRSLISCPPYYRGVYEDLLAEEVNSHLTEELRKIAKDKARKLCNVYLTIIQRHELSENLDGNQVTNPNNPNSNADNNPNGNVDESPNANVNENHGSSVNENANANVNENPLGIIHENPIGNVNENIDGQVNENPAGIGDANGDAGGDANGDASGDGDGNASGDANGDAGGDANGDASGAANGDADGNGDAGGDANGDGDSNGDANGDADGNANGDASSDANGDAGGDAIGDCDANGDAGGDAIGDCDANGNANGDAGDDASGDANGDANGDAGDDANAEADGDNEEDNIFDAWQKISLSYFYLMD